VDDRRALESLQRVSDAALAYLSEDDVLVELLRRVTDILGTDTAAILLLEPSGEALRARAAIGIEEEVERRVRIPVGRGFAGRIAAERRSITIDDVDHGDIVNPILREKGIRSLLGVPLLLEGRVIGVLHVGTLAPRHFTSDDRDLLQLAADRAAIAIEHARLFEQRRLTEALQRRLLPDALPRIPGLVVASRYLPASGESLGGDWYDAFELGAGQVVLAVGDVVGHGPGAAAVMAQLRTALRAYAVEDHSAPEVVARVNRLMWQLGPSGMTTLAYLVLDPEEESLELVNAGHPPPLVIGADGGASYLPLQGSVALGASPLAEYRSERFPFATGAKVVLYTDGLVEDRSRPIDEGLERLRTLGERPDDLERLCSAIIAHMVPGERADDVALIAACLPPLPDHLVNRWPANKDSLASMRRLLRRWLRSRGATEHETYDITVACQEACANAVEHAYSPGRRWFDVEAVHRDGHIRLTVRDTGRWREPRGTHRGRGMPLMRALMEDVDVRHTENGTMVVLERTLGR
jgi:serine phosphatase RsbU (regulator of sigma subunit)/anti-sigma regulatory factor (Ser/Thr protein kinase)